MEKLKTLNETERDDNEGCYFPESCLKKEAIKWITFLKEEDRLIYHDELTQTNHKTIKWIKHFFNITEKDLK